MNCNYSVIIPYRDKYGLLTKAVESIPDREDIQIIIADNSSASLQCEQIPTKERAKVSYFTTPTTRGAGGARNEGLKKAEGSYLLFLDADDYFTPRAFDIFDTFLNQDFDIVFFRPTSVRLADGLESKRHKAYSDYIDDYFKTGNEDNLRFWYTVPWGKMIRAELVDKYRILFDETIASNDLMFSVKTGYYASTITASSDIVYVVTEAGINQSIDKTRNKDTQFARYTVAVSQYKFMEEVGRYDQRFSLLSFVLHSFMDFGLKELVKYIIYAKDNKVNVFVNIKLKK